MKLQSISLWQPWASLIAIGVKTIETRHWQPPHALIGQRIAIHAAKKWDAGLASLTWITPFREDLTAAGLYDFPTRHHRLPLGAVVATAVIAECHSTNRHAFLGTLSERERAYGNYGPNRYGWVLTDVQALVAPIPWRGAQGFFAVEIPNDAQFRTVRAAR